MGKVLVLKSVRKVTDAEGKVHYVSPAPEANGFEYPEAGWVEAPDWDGGKDKCGGKLHGFLFGEGKGSLAHWGDDAAWLVIEVEESEVFPITANGGGKHGFRGGSVLPIAKDRATATEYILRNGGQGKSVIGVILTAGDSGTATAGDYGTATAGYRGTATAGDYGTATAGDSGTATAGGSGTATAGGSGTATAGYRGTATAGDYGTATAGDYGTATAGDYGTATAGYRGTATAGDRGVIQVA